MHVRLLFEQVFSHFGEVWLAWSHGDGITSGMSYIEAAAGRSELGAMARWAVGIGGGAVAYGASDSVRLLTLRELQMLVLLLLLLFIMVGCVSCKPADALVYALKH